MTFEALRFHDCIQLRPPHLPVFLILIEVVLNNSVNETLSRTIRTSVTTLLALTALFIFGGDVLRGFVSALIMGVVVGSYSSVFVASRILLILGVKRDWNNVGSKAGTQFSNIDA